MRLFYVLAENISYTFALSFFTMLIGWISLILGFFLGSSFLVYLHETLQFTLIKWIAPSMLISTLIHFMHFGFLSSLKIPAWQKSHRIMNTAFMQKFRGDHDLVAVYTYFSNTPLQSLLTTFVYALLLCAFIVGFSLYDYAIKSSLSLADLQLLYKMIALSLILAIVVWSITSYVLIELLTNKERSSVYNQLIKKGLIITPLSRIGLRGKFLLIFILFTFILLTFAMLMKQSGILTQYNPYLLVAHFSLAILIPLILLLFATQPILQSLKDMKTVIRQISYGDKTTFNSLPLEKELADIEYSLIELATLHNDYRSSVENKVVQKTSELQNVLTDLEQKENEMQQQLDMASLIQRNTLPADIDSWYELKFAMRYHAMEQIGGDFYDVYQFKNNKLGIIIADVSGHGIPASLVTAVAKTTFNNARLNYDSPRKIFHEVNHNILHYIKTQDYMSCFMVVFDDEYNFVYSNASHQKAIVLRGATGAIELLDTQGLFIGAVSDSKNPYEEKRSKLEYGDRLVLYSDGIPEALNPSHQEYTIEQLQKLIATNKDLPLEDFSDSIITDVKRHIGNAQIQDDMTLLVIELTYDEAVDIIRKAKAMVASHKYGEAIEILENGRGRFADNKNIQYNLAKNYFRTNNFPKVIQELDNYFIKDKYNRFAYYVCGAAYYQLADFDKAIECFYKALQIDANFINALFALAMCHKKKGNLKEALTLFEKVISIDPANKMALFEIKQLNKQTDTPV